MTPPVTLPPLPDVAYSRERPAPGLVVLQPARGYRYGVEVYLLASLALEGAPRTALELGGGSGVVALLLAWCGVDVTIVERDPRWVAVARHNVAASGLVDRVRVVEADARTWRGDPVDVVVSNPPWFRPAAGPTSPDDWKAASRSMLHGTPSEFAAVALDHGPRACFVGPEPPEAAGAWRAHHRRHGRIHLVELRHGAGEPQVTAVDLDAVYGRWGLPAPR